MNDVIAYHYSKRIHLQSILECGYLDPRCTVTGEGERPILWFSTNLYWEPTVRMARYVDGQIITYSMEETYDRVGLIRFGYPVRKLLAWKNGQLRRRARMSKEVAMQLEAVGKEQGANPSAWYGTSQKIWLRKLTIIEVMNDQYKWESLLEVIPDTQGGPLLID